MCVCVCIYIYIYIYVERERHVYVYERETCCVCVIRSVVSNSLQPPWTVARQAPLSMEFSRQALCNGFLFPSPGDLPNPGIEPGSPELHAGYLQSEPPEKPMYIYIYIFFPLTHN